jgi:hypothetical protein
MSAGQPGKNRPCRGWRSSTLGCAPTSQVCCRVRHLGQAVAYTLTNWPALLRFTDDGILAPASNLIERNIRTVAVGRKAWLFAGFEHGGDAAAVAFSPVESCKLADVEPYAYLRDVPQRLDDHRVMNWLHALLPFNWKPARELYPV